jgi:hypothetical protein
MSMDTFLSSIVPLIRDIDDMIDEAEELGFNHEQEKEKD